MYLYGHFAAAAAAVVPPQEQYFFVSVAAARNPFGPKWSRICTEGALEKEERGGQTSEWLKHRRSHYLTHTSPHPHQMLLCGCVFAEADDDDVVLLLPSLAGPESTRLPIFLSIYPVGPYKKIS